MAKRSSLSERPSYYYKHSATCFGADCAFFRKNFIACSELLLRCLIIDRKLYHTWVYDSIYYLKTHIWFDLKFKALKDPV